MIIVKRGRKCGVSGEFKEVEEVYDEYDEKGVEILGFGWKEFMKEEGEGEEGILGGKDVVID